MCLETLVFSVSTSHPFSIALRIYSLSLSCLNVDFGIWGHFAPSMRELFLRDFARRSLAFLLFWECGPLLATTSLSKIHALIFHIENCLHCSSMPVDRRSRYLFNELSESGFVSEFGGRSPMSQLSRYFNLWIKMQTELTNAMVPHCAFTDLAQLVRAFDNSLRAVWYLHVGYRCSVILWFCQAPRPPRHQRLRTIRPWL